MKFFDPGSSEILLKRDGVFPFAFSLAIVSLGTLARIPFQSVLGDASPFLFYWPSVLIVAVLYGLRPGLLAVVAATLQADYFWMPPHWALGINEVEFLQTLTFCFGTSAIACLCEWLHLERQSKEHFRATLANAGEPILTTDCEGRIAYINAAAQALLGLRTDEAVGQFIAGALFLLCRSSGRPLTHALQQALIQDDPHLLPGELVLLSNTGKRHEVRVALSRILDFKGHKIGNVIVFQYRQAREDANRAAMLPDLGPALPPQPC